MNTLEICVDTPDDLVAAIEAGVDRIELCCALDLGGLTPSPGLIEAAKSSPVPIYAMIRPRGRDFVYSEAELVSMEADIQAMRYAGFAGVVFGALTRKGQLDVSALKRLCAASDGLGMTLHRAVDEMDPPMAAIKTAIALGFERILTSGGAGTAVEGVNEIAAMISAADGQIEIMAGSGVSFRNIDLLRKANVWSFHASCREKSDADSCAKLNINSLRKTLAEVRSNQ